VVLGTGGGADFEQYTEMRRDKQYQGKKYGKGLAFFLRERYEYPVFKTK
jgi:hypothetical protein